MKNSNRFIFAVATFFSIFTVACGNQEEKVKNGVMYASRALQEANANPLSRATYENIIGRGGTALDYIKYITPKDDPMLGLFEYERPTKPWTVVIRSGGQPGEYFVAGYGSNLKEPLTVETVVVKTTSE
jgi:hypothetical protein